MFQRVASTMLVFTILLCITPNYAFPEVSLRKEQTVYVPAYPHVFIGPRGTVFELTMTLIVRNTDLKKPISVTAVEYYDTGGILVKKFLSTPLKLNPMASTHILITEKDSSGGIGANFIVRWKAETEVNAPIIESVMIGGRSGQGISFIGIGQEIRD